MSFAFDEDTAVEPLADGRFAARISDRWNIADVPNGGYLMCVALQAVSRSVGPPDLLTASGHFLTPTGPGPVEVRVEVVKEGRTLSTAAAALIQDDRERLRVLATYTDLDRFDGPTVMAEEAPDPGPDLVSGSVGGPLVRMAGQFRYQLPPDVAAGALGRPTGEARLTGRIRFADDRPPDVACLPLIVDAFPPAVFQLGLYGWTPTLDLTVHGRARPAPGWLTCSIRTRFLQNGLLDEDVEVWDSAGVLVATSRQLARAAMAGQASAGTTSRANLSSPDVS